MKKIKVESFADIIFKGRNKEYGAYVLRRRYIRRLMIAIVIALVFPLGVWVYSIVMINARKQKAFKQERWVKTQILYVPKDELPPPPPPPPVRVHRPSKAVVKKIRFTAPVVVEKVTDTVFATQDELNTMSNVEAPGEEEIKYEIREIPETKPKVIAEPKVPVKKEIFMVVEEQPKFPGGAKARIKFLRDNLRYPAEAREMGIQGRVFVTFVVETDGSITDVRILRGIGGGCDQEALRVVRAMPKWIPGKQRGIPVRVQFNLPIKFTLQ